MQLSAIALAITRQSQILAGGSTDPYAAYTVLILNGQGANGGTTITDSSTYNRTPDLTSAVISTAQAKYGVSSIYFSGTQVRYANTSDFNIASNDFTVEAWVRPENLTGFKTICGLANGSAQNSNYAFSMYQSGSSWTFSVFSGNTVYGGVAGTAVANVWQHVALSRVGNTLYICLDGAVIRTADVTGITFNNPAGATLGIGILQGFYPNAGYMHLRFTNGVGRYSGAYTPPLSFL